MSTPTETSDGHLLELLRQRGAMSVAEMAQAICVTATAVRQRLVRLMGQGLIARDVARQGRGRPSHRYSLTEKARRQAGNNYADLALVLWKEIRAIEDPEVRRGLLKRLAAALAGLYRRQVQGASLRAKMESLQEMLNDRRVAVRVEPSPASQPPETPVLTVVDCPYPALAEQDRGVCAMENMLFAELLGTPMTLSRCRLDGHDCCQFQSS